MNIIKKYKKYLKISGVIWAVCLALFVLSWFLVMSPEYEKTKKIERDLVESQQDYELAQQAAQEETKTRLNEEIELLENKLDVFVLNFKSAADLNFDISRIAEESKVTSFNIESNDMRAAAASADPNNIFEKNVKVSFIAGFREFAVFLNSLERHQPVLFVKEFALSRQNNSKETYQVTLDIAALVQKQQVTKNTDEEAKQIVGAAF